MSKAGKISLRCSHCSKRAKVVHGNYRFKESGLDNVVLCGIEILKCSQCKNEDPIIPAMNDLFRTIALALAAKPYGLAGEEVRFLRKHMGMIGDGFCRLLHVDRTTLSKWETNDDPVGAQSDLAIRMLAMAEDAGLRKKMPKVIHESFEKIQFRNRERPIIEIDPSDYSYAYA